MLSGVYVGTVEDYTLLDGRIGCSRPFARSTQLIVNATNILDDRHLEMIGAPQLGPSVSSEIKQKGRPKAWSAISNHWVA